MQRLRGLSPGMAGLSPGMAGRGAARCSWPRMPVQDAGERRGV